MRLVSGGHKTSRSVHPSARTFKRPYTEAFVELRYIYHSGCLTKPYSLKAESLKIASTMRTEGSTYVPRTKEAVRSL